MYAVIGEDKSDVETLKVLIRRLAKNTGLRIQGKGYEGCAQMLRKGAAQLAMFARKPFNCTRFIVCYDADFDDPNKRFKAVVDKIILPARVHGLYCVAIPIQELESWILADIEAVNHVIRGWVPAAVPNPEAVQNPKEHIEKLSRDSNRRPRYSHAMHNQRVAQYLNLDVVARKCPSFVPLMNFVTRGISNLPGANT